MVADTIMARELALFLENDFPTYKSFITPYAVNLARKKLKGQFSKEKALQGLVNQVPRFKQRYERENGVKLGTMDMATKKAFAKEFYEGMEELVKENVKRLKRAEALKKKTAKKKPTKRKK